MDSVMSLFGNFPDMNGVVFGPELSRQSKQFDQSLSSFSIMSNNIRGVQVAT